MIEIFLLMLMLVLTLMLMSIIVMLTLLRLRLANHDGNHHCIIKIFSLLLVLMLT